MKTTFNMGKQELSKTIITATDIISYYAGSDLPEGTTDRQRDIISGANRDWDALPCDSDGATKEQEQAMDQFIDDLLKSFDSKPTRL